MDDVQRWLPSSTAAAWAPCRRRPGRRRATSLAPGGVARAAASASTGGGGLLGCESPVVGRGLAVHDLEEMNAGVEVLGRWRRPMQ